MKQDTRDEMVQLYVFPQDLHLHKFFQHCQLMKTMSDGNPAELIKYLKVRSHDPWLRLRRLLLESLRTERSPCFCFSENPSCLKSFVGFFFFRSSTFSPHIFHFLIWTWTVLNMIPNLLEIILPLFCFVGFNYLLSFYSILCGKESSNISGAQDKTCKGSEWNTKSPCHIYKIRLSSPFF